MFFKQVNYCKIFIKKWKESYRHWSARAIYEGFRAEIWSEILVHC